MRNIVYLKQKYTQDDFLQEDVKDPLVSDSAESDIKQGICSNVEESAREIEAVDLINIESILTSDVNLKQNDEKIQNDSYTKTSSFECKLCDYKCEEVYFLTLHLKQKHNPLDSENCEHCGKVFCYDPGIRSNADDNPCKFCSINTIELKQNVESNSNFLCDRCPFRCNITETMMQHLSDQHGIANPYLRLHCDKLFVESDDKLLRTEPKKFKCKFCSYKSVSRSGVNAHTATRHGIVCGPSTKKAKQPNLKSMILACSECPLVYVGKDALIRHMETTHWKRNSCHICEKVFPSKEVLDSHVEIHSSDELYRCLTCDYKCATKEFLRLHIENKHNMIVSVDECDNDKCMEDKVSTISL